MGLAISLTREIILGRVFVGTQELGAKMVTLIFFVEQSETKLVFF